MSFKFASSQFYCFSKIYISEIIQNMRNAEKSEYVWVPCPNNLKEISISDDPECPTHWWALSITWEKQWAQNVLHPTLIWLPFIKKRQNIPSTNYYITLMKMNESKSWNYHNAWIDFIFLFFIILLFPEFLLFSSIFLWKNIYFSLIMRRIWTLVKKISDSEFLNYVLKTRFLLTPKFYMTRYDQIMNQKLL